MTTAHHTASSVHVGTPPPGFREWSRTNVYFHDFANLPAEKGRLVRSDSFECLGHAWRVGMYPGGERITNPIGAADADAGGGAMASVVLCNRSSVDVLFGFGVKDGTGREVGGTSSHSLASGRRATISDFLRRSKIMKSLVDGTLVIEVRMKPAGEPRTGPTNPPPPPPPPRFAPEDIRSTVADEETAGDVVTRVGEHWEESNSMDLIETTSSSSSAAAALRDARRFGEMPSAGSATSGLVGGDGDVVPKRRGILRSRSSHRNRADDRSECRTRVVADDDGGVEERPRGSRRDREREHPTPDPREQSPPPHQGNIRSTFADEETADELTRVEEYRGEEGDAINLAKTSSNTSHARRYGEKPSDATSGPGENGFPKQQQGILRSRSRSRPRDQNRVDRSKPAPDRREHSPQRLRGESLRDYWRRRAEESKERVSRGSVTSSVGEEDTLGSGRSLTSGGTIATPSGKIVISNMPSLLEGELFR